MRCCVPCPLAVLAGPDSVSSSDRSRLSVDVVRVALFVALAAGNSTRRDSSRADGWFAQSPGYSLNLMGGASLFCLSIALLYAVYYPLWHLLPDWFRWWYTQDSAVIYSAQGHSNYLADSINLLILVLVGPLVEELFFRCLLLPSWVARWGVRTGVILSSLAFAGIHGDIVGAFIFAIAVSLAFLRTRKFWLVFIIHATHNALVWLFALGEMSLGYGSDAATPDFLLLGVASFLVGLSLLYVAVRRAPQSEPSGPE